MNISLKKLDIFLLLCFQLREKREVIERELQHRAKQIEHASLIVGKHTADTFSSISQLLSRISLSAPLQI